MINQRLNLYTAAQTRELDRLAIEEVGIPGYDLMKKAGASAFHFIMSTWPNTKSLTIVCGTGNNGGDGYVIAKLAKTRGIAVRLIQVGDLSKQSGDARLAREDMEVSGIIGEVYESQDLSNEEVLVDALLGTGLQRDVENQWREIIEVINRSSAKVAAIDIPSGLNADTGVVQGVAVKADLSVTFIGRKQGMYTADGPEKCGEIKFDSLSIPQLVYDKVKPSSFALENKLSPLFLQARHKNSHKGAYGHLIFIGGAPGMNGAIFLAASAGLRSGCGLVTVFTHPEHAAFLNLGRPEIMCRGAESFYQMKNTVDAADVVVIGPGLGQKKWGQAIFEKVVHIKKPLVIDADGLNCLSDQRSNGSPWVLTPHPGEAASLLTCSIHDVQQNRFAAVKEISDKFDAVCVLKGSGTLIHYQNKTYVCSAGNPGMATAGMGDVLSGILATLLAQGLAQRLSLVEIVNNAVLLHAMAADNVAHGSGEKGMLASDLFPEIRRIINDR